MATNAIVNSLTFIGSVAGQASIQSQGLAGGLTFLLPNTSPIQGQLVSVTSVNGNSVFLGWSSAQSLSNIPLTALSVVGASSGDVIQFNGTNWAVSSFVPGSGTVTSVALTAPAEFSVGGSPITGAGTLAITKANQSANTVWAGPATGSAAAPAFRALVVADIPSLPYLSSSTQLPVTFSPVASQFLNSYTSSTGVFTAAQPDFTDLTGAATIAQINSKRGNGSFVQLAASGTAGTAGDVVTFDANGNTVDSAVLLSSLATTAQLPTTIAAVTNNFLTSYTAGTETFTQAQPASTDLSDVALLAYLASPAFSGVPTAPTATPGTSTTQIATNAYADAAVAVETGRATTAEGLLAPITTPQFIGIVTAATIAAPSGSNLNFTTADAHEVEITTASGTFEFEGSGGGMSFVSNTATIAISAAGAITIAPASGQSTAITGGSGNGTTFASAGSNLHSATAGDLLSSDGAGNVQDSGTSVNNVGLLTGQTGTSAAFPDNHTASGTAVINGITPVTVTLTNNAVFSSAATYVVQIAYQGAIGGAKTGVLSVTNSSGTAFTIVSTDTTDTTSTIAWTAVGLA